MHHREASDMTEHAGERLARFVGHTGIASRRQAEELIAAGRVQVNGVTVTSQGTRIDPEHDEVRIDGTPVHSTARNVYVLLHKPVNYVSTVHDPQGRPTVLDLLPAELRRLRVYPVGRLDRDTSGLLLLTNDGDFALRMSHPRYSMEKHYHALVHRCPTPASLEALRRGVTITEGDRRNPQSNYTTAPARVSLLRQEDADCWLTLTIHEGRKRQVRRMLAAIGHPVLQLIRDGIGSLALGNLPVGAWRYLAEEEVPS